MSVDLIISIIIGIPLGLLFLKKMLEDGVSEEYKAWVTQNGDEK
jgi:hypothetical protein